MNVLTSILFMIVTACGVAIVAKLIQFANTKIDEVQKRIHNETINNLIDHAQTIITTAVTSVSQTYVSKLKEQGAFDGEAAKKAKQEAINIINELMTIKTRQALADVYGDVNAYIDHAIEDEVKWTH